MENILFRSERLVPSWNLLLPTVLLYYHFVPLNVNFSTILPFILEANQLKCELNRSSDTSPRHWLRFVMPYFDGISYPFLLKFLQFLLGVSKDSWNFNQCFLSMPTIALSKISGAHRRFLFLKKGGIKKRVISANLQQRIPVIISSWTFGQIHQIWWQFSIS